MFGFSLAGQIANPRAGSLDDQPSVLADCFPAECKLPILPKPWAAITRHRSTDRYRSWTKHRRFKIEINRPLLNFAASDCGMVVEKFPGIGTAFEMLRADVLQDAVMVWFLPPVFWGKSWHRLDKKRVKLRRGFSSGFCHRSNHAPGESQRSESCANLLTIKYSAGH